jgi:hypothetical protein
MIFTRDRSDACKLINRTILLNAFPVVSSKTVQILFHYSPCSNIYTIRFMKSNFDHEIVSLSLEILDELQQLIVVVTFSSLA